MIHMSTVNIVIIIMLFLSLSLYSGKKLSTKFVCKEKIMFWWLYLLAIGEFIFLFMYGMGMYGLKNKRGTMGETGRKGAHGKRGKGLNCLECSDQ